MTDKTLTSPQVEDGYTRIANELMDAFAKTKLSTNETQVLFTVLRKTYGWRKKADKISLNQFKDATGLLPQHIHRILKKLEQRHIITINKNGYVVEYGIQKDYTLWTITSVGNTSVGNTSVGNTSVGTKLLPAQVIKLLPAQVITKEKKEIKKEREGGTLSDYINKLRQEYSDIDFETVLEKCYQHYKELKKVVTSVMILNWLKREREYNNKRQPPRTLQGDRTSRYTDVTGIANKRG